MAAGIRNWARLGEEAKVGDKAMSTIGLVDALANTRIGGPDGLIVNIWFTPKQTGIYDIFKTMLITAEQAAAQGKPPNTYANGDNGIIELAVNGMVLGTYKPQVWPKWTFPMGIQFCAGQQYTFRFKNISPDPVKNYCSLDALRYVSPLVPPTAGVSYIYKNSLTDRGYAPIFSLESSIKGMSPISYGWMEVVPAVAGRIWRQVSFPGLPTYWPNPALPIRKGTTSGAAADGTVASFPDPAPGEWAEFSDDGGKTWQQLPGKPCDLQYVIGDL